MPRIKQSWMKTIDEFVDLRKWHRSRRGNLTREWDDSRLTIYQRHGRFSWCINYSEEETVFSPRSFETEDDCLDHLRVEMMQDLMPIR